MKIKRNLCKFIALVLVMCTTLLVNVNDVAAASSTIVVQFLDVASSSSVSEKKGDATLIRYKDKFYLIDTGTANNYDLTDTTTTPLEARLDTMVKAKQSLAGIILTHNHADHMGAVVKILKNSKAVNSKTKLYYNGEHNDASQSAKLSNAIKEAKKLGGAVAIKYGQIYNVITNSVVNAGYVASNKGLYIYGSTIPGATSSRDGNNASMIVQFKNGELNALLMGDLLYEGIHNVANNAEYMYGISSCKYKVCKFGHHGLRNAQNSVKNNPTTIAQEFSDFYNKLTIKDYVFTTTDDVVKKSNYYSNYLSILNHIPGHNTYFSNTVPKYVIN